MKKFLFKKTIFKILSFIILSLCQTMYSQRDNNFALYKYHMHIFNPAFTGTQGGTYVNTTYRRQLSGLENGPQIQALSLGIPSREKRMSYGLLFLNDKTFIEQQIRFNVLFSYKLELDTNWNLRLGLNAGGENFGVNFSELKNLEISGDSKLENYSRFNPNFGFGFYLSSERYFFAMSIPKILETKLFKDQDGISTNATDRFHLYTSAGLKLPIKGNWSWVAYALARYVKAAPWSIVTNGGVAYKNIELSFGYQWDASYSVALMIKDFKFMSFGYSYQLPSSAALSSITGGNHEVLVKIRLSNPKTITDQEEDSLETKDKEKTIETKK